MFRYTDSFNAYTSNDYINLINLCETWFEKDSESEFAKELVEYLGNVYNTSFTDAKKKIKEYLNKINTDHPGTVIGIWSKAYLEKYKNEN